MQRRHNPPLIQAGNDNHRPPPFHPDDYRARRQRHQNAIRFLYSALVLTVIFWIAAAAIILSGL